MVSLWVGIIIGLVSSFVQSLGLTVQRKDHTLDQAKHPEYRKVEWKRPLWLFGFTIFITSNVLGTVFQVGALPIVVLAPLGAISLLWNALFAKFLLGDRFTHFMILGTILITGGAVLIAAFGVVPEPTHDLNDLVRLFGRPQWMAYISVLSGVIILGLILSHTIERFMWNRIDQQLGPIQLPPSSLFPPSSPKPPLPNPTQPGSASPESRTQLILSLAYASISGTLSGLCLLIAKSAIELLLLTLSPGSTNQFNSLTTFYLLLSLLILALAQLVYLNKALRLASPTVVCPLAFSFYNLSSVFGGLVYFDQLRQLTAWQIGLVCLGVGVLLGGVGVVSLIGEEGNGGVEVGVWVEEEDEEQGEENATDEQPYTDLQDSERRRLMDEEADCPNPWKLEPSSPLSPSSEQTEPPSGSRKRPVPPPIHPFLPSRRSSSDLPTSPLSPNGARRGSALRKYIPSSHFAHHSEDGLPALAEPHAVFSIGLGAASPGFKLRSGPGAKRRSLDGTTGGFR